jgi:excisionase family DNA binding protein
MNISTATLPPQPRAYSLTEGQRILSLSRSTLRRLEITNKIRLIRIGRRVLIPADEVERLLSDGAR